MVVFNVFSEGDKARQRGDERSHAADVYPEQQRFVIAGKLRQQNRRRHVADTLARKCGYEQSIFLHEPVQQFFYRRNTSHISCEDKEGDEGQK